MNPQRQRTNEGGDSCMVADLCPARRAESEEKERNKKEQRRTDAGNVEPI